MSAEPFTQGLERIATSYIPAFVLLATVELGLFDQLETKRSIAELAGRVGATADGVRRLCRVLATMGLLEMRGEWVEANPDALRALSRRGDRSIADVLMHHRRQVAPLFAELPRAVRTGRPQHGAWPFVTGTPAPVAYSELERHPDELATFLSAMDHASAGVGNAMVPVLREHGVERLVDFGCGGGAVARELLAAMPELTIESFDLESAAAIARERSERAGLAARHQVRAGDLVEGPGGDADGVLLSAVLADWSEGERGKILAHARRCLRPGGHVFVSETLLDDDGSGPASAAMFSLVMLLAMRGDQLSFRELSRELEAARFVEVTLRRGGPRDLVVARAG